MSKLMPIERGATAATLAEVLISSTVTLMITAGLMVGSISLQRSFHASEHHARSQAEQARILDQISLDLRRALTVSVAGSGPARRISLTVPDFYDATGKPRDPVMTSDGQIVYGNVNNPTSIAYYKNGGTIYRESNGVAAALATNVQDFALDYTDTGKQVVGVSVSFVPKYQLNPQHQLALRAGTATYATTLLRNKRRN